MKTSFLGSFYPKERYSEILGSSKYFDFAGDALQWSLLNGFSQLNFNINTITVPATKKIKNLYLTKSRFSHNNKSLDYCVGFIDIVGLKQIQTSFKVYKILRKPGHIPNCIFIYSIQNNLLRAAYLYKKKNPDTKILLFITDLPEYMRENSNIVYKTLKSLEIKDNAKYINCVDGFIFLSEHMKEKIAINNKPYIVIEGIFNSNDINIKHSNNSNNINTFKILYSGTLARRYGIMNLVNAFHTINNKNFELIILGRGDTEEEINHYCKIDNRIKYLGSVERGEVLKMQQEVDLLVNPRMPEGEYVKYSFPSKTMEYLASGTPTLLYRLPGIPAEYYDYCYTVKGISIESLANSILSVYSKPSNELEKMGKSAKEFILLKKNPQVQCQKIINFIESIVL